MGKSKRKDGVRGTPLTQGTYMKLPYLGDPFRILTHTPYGEVRLEVTKMMTKWLDYESQVTTVCSWDDFNIYRQLAWLHAT